MDIPYTKKEIIVGIFLIIFGILLLTILLFIGRGKEWFQNYAMYYTIFDEKYNLPDDAAVKLYNAEIGKVVNITLFEDKVKVELKILEDYQQNIKTDSVATVRNVAFFYGPEYVAIKPGSPNSDVLPEGEEIPSEPRKSIADLLNEFGMQDTANKIISIFKDIGDIYKRLRNPEGPLASALQHLSETAGNAEKIARDVEEGKGTTGQLLKSAELMKSILSELEKIGSIFIQIEETSEKTPKAMSQVKENLNKVEHILNDAFESIVHIKKAITDVESSSHEIPDITQSTRLNIKEMRDALEKADKIIQSLQKNLIIRSNLPPEPEVEKTDAGLQ